MTGSTASSPGIRLPIGVALLLLTVWSPAARSGTESLQQILKRGDTLWAARDRGARDGWADPEPIAEAVALYEKARNEAPESPAVAWRLTRALWFQAEYATRDPDRSEATLDRATEIAEEGLTELATVAGGRERLASADPEERARILRDRPEATPLYFWAAVAWGVWGEVSGKIAAARQGVGDRIRRYATTVIALDESYEHGGGHRVLGRLHAEAPKIPFFTGWVNRERAIRELEEAWRRFPEHLLNPLYLAEALLDHRPEQTPRARDLVKTILETEPDAARRVEETRARIRARELLGELTS